MKILVIRFSSIGDIILCSPILRVLKHQGNYKVHFLTKKSYRQVIEHNPYIDKIHVFKDDMQELIPNLKTESFDLILDLHKNLRSLRIKFALNTRYITFNKLNLKKWWLVNMGRNLLPKVHIVDRYFSALSDIGILNDGLGLDYFYGKNDKVKADSILQDEKWLGISLGATYQTKRLPRGKLIALSKGLKISIVLLGGNDVEEDALAIMDNARSNSKVLDLVGKLSLNETAAVVDRLSLLITYDSGLMHMRAAFKKPLISLWGNTVPSFGMYPYFGNFAIFNKQFEVSGLKCRPCSKLGSDNCPKKHFKCMEEQDISRIIEIVHQFFGHN